MKRLAAWLLLAASVLFLQPYSLHAQSAQSAQVQHADAGAKLDSLLAGRDYPGLAAELKSAKLDATTHDYFAGVLANRENRLNDAVALLEKGLPNLKVQSRKRAGIALRTLADSYWKLYRYADAARAFTDVYNNFADTFDKDERKSLEDDYKTSLLLTDVPPQSVSMDRALFIKTHASPLGTIDTDLTLNGVTTSWIVDTGANFSVVSSSMARKLGLKVSDKTATTQGITGAENKLHTAVIPDLSIGSAVVHNVVVLVLDDSNLNVPLGENRHYQIEAILGYPVLSAFGALTFRAGEITSGPMHPTVVFAGQGAPMYMEQLMPLLLCRVLDRDVIFQFDTGANHSLFTRRFHDQFSRQLANVPERPYGLGGAGGTKRVMVRYQPQLSLAIGRQTAVLKDAPVLAERLGTDLDKLNGNLGRDVVQNFDSFTIDFRNMLFTLGEPKKASPEKSKSAKAGE